MTARYSRQELKAGFVLTLKTIYFIIALGIMKLFFKLSQLVLSFILILFSAFFLSGWAYSEDGATDSALMIKPVVTQVPVEINYMLPYPGLLPDSPLYFIKAARDRIIGFFISNPLKRASFDLLQADKRLNMGVYLMNEHKYDMVATIVSKGENYFSEGLTQLRQAKTQGNSIGEQVKIFTTSSTKHIEVIKKLEEQVKTDNLKRDLEQQVKRVEDFEETLRKMGK